MAAAARKKTAKKKTTSKKKATRKYSKAAGEYVREEMEEMKAGKLRSGGSGKNTSQAISNLCAAASHNSREIRVSCKKV